MRQPGWDKYEVALLIETCEQTLNNRALRSNAVVRLSTALRQRALKSGVVIDSVFRNENGITLQMTKMDYLLTEGRTGLPGASKLYAEIAKLKKDNPTVFQKLLRDASKQIWDKEAKIELNYKEEFSEWLSNNPLKKIRPDTIIQALEEASHYCRTHGICKESFWDIDDKSQFTSVTSKLLGMRFYRITHKTTANILDKAVRLYKEFLGKLKADETVTSSAKIQSREDLYQKLYSISRVYDDPSGISISKIKLLVGKEVDEQHIKTVLDEVEWATKLSDDVYSFSARVSTVSREPIALKETTSVNVATDSAFHTYLHDKRGMAEASCRSYVSAIRAAEDYAKRKKYNPYKIYDSAASDAIRVIQLLLGDADFAEFNIQQHHRFSAAFAKFSEFIGQATTFQLGNTAKAVPATKDEPTDFDKAKFEQALLSRYRNGMQFDSIDFENFREMYETLFDESLSFDDAGLEKRLRYCGVFYKDRLFPADGIIDETAREKLFAYIDSSFSSGKQVLYYKAIFKDLSDAFANCFTLSDEHMLHAYIEFVAEKGKYFFFPEYMAIERIVSIDHVAEIAEFMLGAGKPVATDEVCAKLSHIPDDQVVRIITSDSRFLRNAKSEYFHIDIFEISEDELECILEIINGFIQQNEYAIWTDVWNEIQDKMPVFIENNLYLSGLGIRNVLAQRFNGRLHFESAVISMPKDRYAMRDIYQLYAKHHAEFTADDIYSLSKELDTVIYFDALAEVSVRVSHDLFVSKDRIHFDIDAVDKAIGSFVSKDYIRIREIDSYLVFPNVGYEWNEYLLESFVYSYSKKYLLLNNGFSLHNVAGAVVKKNGSIQEFVDACAALLADAPIALNKKDVLSYLAEIDMITRRSYRDLDLAIRKATQIRARKG